jgi:hypothetical protein
MYKKKKRSPGFDIHLNNYLLFPAHLKQNLIEIRIIVTITRQKETFIARNNSVKVPETGSFCNTGRCPQDRSGGKI